MKIILLLAIMFARTTLNAQSSTDILITIVGSHNDTIEIGKEYSISADLKDKKAKLKASGCGVKLLFRDQKYFITSERKGEFMLYPSRNGKVIGAPFKFYSVKLF
jgi:hypothetical protein